MGWGPGLSRLWREGTILYEADTAKPIIWTGRPISGYNIAQQEI